MFERRVQFRHGDGSESYGYIDLYRCGCFVLEAKDVREASDSRYDAAMLRAHSQAEAYARALHAVVGVLAASAGLLSATDIAARFTARGAWKKRLPPLPDMLAAPGRAREHAGRYSSL